MKCKARFGFVGSMALAFALSVSGCSSIGGIGGMGQKETIGTIGGAALGGFLGSEIGGKGAGGKIGVGLGVLLGGLLGNYIGKELDEADRLAVERSAHQALEYQPDGYRENWRNPNTGNHGYTEPTRTWQNPQTGEYCREYQTTIIVGGKKENAYGTACRKPDGAWKIQ